MKTDALAPGQNDELGKICRQMIETTLRGGKIKDAQTIVKHAYKQRLGGGHKGKGPNFTPEVQDRVAAGGLKP